MARFPFPTSHRGLFLCALAATLAASPVRAELFYIVGSDTAHDFHRFPLTDTVSPSISHSYSTVLGSSTVDVTYGQLDVNLHAIRPDSSGNGSYSGDAYWLDTYTIDSPGLTGTTGTARFTFQVDSNLLGTATNSFAWQIFSDISQNSGPEYQSATTFDPAAIHTFTTDYTFTFGSPFDMGKRLFAFANANDTAPTAITLDMSIRTAGLEVLSGGNAVNYSALSRTGSSSASNITINTPYIGFALTNSSPDGHGTALSILDGTASGSTSLSASFGPGQIGDVLLVGDSVNFSGTASDKFVLQLSYDPSIAIGQYGTDAGLVVLWLNPATNTWMNAVLGNSDGGAAQQHFIGAYDSGTEFALGNFGIDTVNHVVWAVVDHNSTFGVATVEPVPEPAEDGIAISVLLLGATLCRRRAMTS